MRAVGAVRVKASVNRNVKGGGLWPTLIYSQVCRVVGGLVLPRGQLQIQFEEFFFFSLNVENHVRDSTNSKMKRCKEIHLILIHFINMTVCKIPESCDTCLFDFHPDAGH